ncbi:MAG: hypothetical protein ACOVNU_04260 [Candidatus Kapaibacteriota bacterium]
MRGNIYPKTENFVGGNGKVTSTDISNVASAVGEVAGVIITSLGAVKDAKLRRQYEIRIAELNRIEQADLSKKLVAAQNDNDKRKVFSDILTSTSIARINALNKKGNYIYLYVLGGVVILGAAFLIYKKYNK